MSAAAGKSIYVKRSNPYHRNRIIQCRGSTWLIKYKKANPAAFLWALLHAEIVRIGQIFRDKPLDKMQFFNLSSIVYPASISICIVSFIIFCSFFRHERFNLLNSIGLRLMIAAIIMLFSINIFARCTLCTQ